MRFGTKTIITGAVVGLLALGLTVPALAATDAPVAGTAWGGICRGTGAAASAVSKLLGMEPSQIAAERQAGKSLTDIAASKNVSKDALVSTMLESRKAVLDQAVKDGRLTQAQADLMLKNMQTRIDERVSDPTVGPRNGGPGGGAGAGCGQGGGRGGAGLGMRAGQAFGATTGASL